MIPLIAIANEILDFNILKWPKERKEEECRKASEVYSNKPLPSELKFLADRTTMVEILTNEMFSHTLGIPLSRIHLYIPDIRAAAAHLALREAGYVECFPTHHSTDYQEAG